jgi:hypothetical protein
MDQWRQTGSQGSIPLASGARVLFAGALVIPRGHATPRGQSLRGAHACHVDTPLRDQQFRPSLVDAGNRIQHADRACKGQGGLGRRWSRDRLSWRGGVGQRAGRSAEIGEALQVQAHQMFHWWHRVRDGTLAHASFASYMWPIRYEVERLLEAGQTCGVPKTEGMCRDILKRRQALWTFVRHVDVEPTNNVAERAIRPAVLWRKGSFATHSPEGSGFAEAIMTVVATLKQQHRHVLNYLTTACEAALRGEPVPSLLLTLNDLEQLMRLAA